MFKFKASDEVIINSGKDKGKKGKIEKVLEREDKVVIDQINVYKRHRKATRNQKSGIFEISRPIQTSKISVICPKCSKPTRVGFKIQGKNKNRICKKCQGSI